MQFQNENSPKNREAKNSNTIKYLSWLAPQCRCHPALPNFPANRDFYREFCKYVPSCRPEPPNSAATTARYTQIPYSTEQGIILAEQGILPQEQGISTGKNEIIAG
jgi:hypothetical protein